MFVIVLGLSPTGLYVLRELGRASVPCGGVAEGIQCGEASQFLTVSPALRSSGASMTLIKDLDKIAERRGERGLLIPTSDSFINFVAENNSALTRNFDFQDSYTKETVDLIVNKARFLEKCAAAGVEAPRYQKVDSQNLVNVAGELSFPLIIKPALIQRVKSFMAGRKVLIIRDRKEFDEIARQIPSDADTTWLVQEIIAGPESNIVLFSGYRDREGNLHQGFTARKLRQYPPGFGSASLVRSETLPDVYEAAERLLEALNFHGIAGIEMKVDSRDGLLKIIEMNPRPSLWFAAGTAAGRCASLAAFCDITGAKMPEEVPQKDGHIWRYRLKDMYSARWYSRHGDDFVLPPPDIGDALHAPESHRVGAVYASDDPAPSLRELQNYAGKAMSRLKRLKRG